MEFLFAFLDKAWRLVRGAGLAGLGRRLGLSRLKNMFWRERLTLPDGALVVLRPSDHCVVDEVYGNQVYGAAGAFKPGQIVVDLGGHIGLFALYAAKHVGPQGRVVVCEPGPDNLALLNKNVALNGLAQITVHACAVGEREGAVDFFIAADGVENPVTNTLTDGPGRRRVQVPMRTLDMICNQEKLTRIDHLKIDVEGAELRVLQGGARSLQMTRRLIMEIHPAAVDPKTVVAELEKAGFSVKTLSQRPLLIEALR